MNSPSLAGSHPEHRSQRRVVLDAVQGEDREDIGTQRTDKAATCWYVALELRTNFTFLTVERKSKEYYFRTFQKYRKFKEECL